MVLARLGDVAYRGLEFVEERRSNRSQSPKSPGAPVLDDFIEYYASEGLVGEQDTAALATLAFASGLSFGIEGPSGSGKSCLADMIADLGGESVYRLDLSTDTALINSAEHLENYRVIYTPELQRATGKGKQVSLEVIKSIAEGRDANMIVRVGPGKTITLRITGEKMVMYTLASENPYDKNRELSRRVIELYTDSSEDLTERIIAERARARGNRSSASNGQRKRLSTYLRVIAARDLQVVNPFAEFTADFFPTDAPVFRSLAENFYNLIDAHARFNHRQRHSQGNTIYASIEDVQAIHAMYPRHFATTACKIHPEIDYHELVFMLQDIPWRQCEEFGRQRMQHIVP